MAKLLDWGLVLNFLHYKFGFFFFIFFFGILPYDGMGLKRAACKIHVCMYDDCTTTIHQLA